MAVKTIEWRNDTVRMIDQRLLPSREIIRVYRDWRGVAEAIRTMVIRGAPAIGVAAAMGVALGMRGLSGARAQKRFAQVARGLRATRPTAVNLAWAVQRMTRQRAGPMVRSIGFSPSIAQTDASQSSAPRQGGTTRWDSDSWADTLSKMDGGLAACAPPSSRPPSLTISM